MKTFILEYRDKRQKKTFDINIEDTSNWADREKLFFDQEIARIQGAYAKAEYILTQRAEALLDGKNGVEGWKDRLKELDAQDKELENEFKNYSKTDYFKRRFELIKDILEFNGCDNDMLYEYKFWDRKVTQKEINRFIDFVFDKEVKDDKKGGQPKK